MPNEKKNDEEHGVRLSYKFRMIDDDKRRETARRLRAAAEQADPAVGVSELEIFCILDVDMGGERGFADMQDVLRLADLIDRPARQGSEKGDER